MDNTGKDRYCMISLICGLKTNPKLINTENRLTDFTEAEVKVGEMDEGGQKLKMKKMRNGCKPSGYSSR